MDYIRKCANCQAKILITLQILADKFGLENFIMNSEDKQKQGLKSLNDAISEIINELKRSNPLRYSDLWFFIKYLKQIKKKLSSAERFSHLNSAFKGLDRFFLDLHEPSEELSLRYELIRRKFFSLKNWSKK